MHLPEFNAVLGPACSRIFIFAASMRIWIAAFLLFLFACQALPVANLGKSWVKTQLSATDGADDEDGGSGPESGKVKKQSPLLDEDYDHAYAEASVLCSVQATRQIALHRPDHLPVLYAGEVLTPPPDRC